MSDPSKLCAKQDYKARYVHNCPTTNLARKRQEEHKESLSAIVTRPEKQSGKSL